MNEQEEQKMAWALWHLLSQLADALWDRYERSFMDFCIDMDRSSIWDFGHNTDVQGKGDGG